MRCQYKAKSMRVGKCYIAGKNPKIFISRYHNVSLLILFQPLILVQSN